ncbi:MAG TPA: NYN domain-containing protein [Gemmatimonadaceae bacterium]
MTAQTYGAAPFVHAPNAALLIDFDNVTMGIRSDLGHELRNLLSSDIIKGKVAVQRAYADWRRYPQYVVPLTEASIDLIWAPAYGSSKKNATDIRLAIDALELVFTRPEIGTIILLSGDSDFSSLVIKLKEYGKYVIGVGIRESSSDLLVMNCDEYYSYNALAGLVKSGEDEQVSRDPWELVVEAVSRMKRNGDVMRADRLKQVMQDIDNSFDEKNLGMAKFSRFVTEAAQRGLLKLTKLENGQMEVDATAEGAPPVAAAPPAPRAAASSPSGLTEERANGTEDGARRGRRSRGRGRDRNRGAPAGGGTREAHAAPAPAEQPVQAPSGEMTGERLTREEALDLVQRAVQHVNATAAEPVPAASVRRAARELLGRDSESLNERFFHRILRDAHDAERIDLRRHGEDYEVAPAAARAAAAAPASPAATAASADVAADASQAQRSAANAASLRRGMRHRGMRTSRGGELPPDLLSVGVVGLAPAAAVVAEPEPVVASAPAPEAEASAAEAPAAPPRSRSRRGGKSGARGRTSKATAAVAAGSDAPAAKPRRSRGGGRAKKKAAEPTTPPVGGEG